MQKIYMYDDDGKFYGECGLEEFKHNFHKDAGRIKVILNNMHTHSLLKLKSGNVWVRITDVKYPEVVKYSRRKNYPLYAVKEGKVIAEVKNETEMLQYIRPTMVQNILVRSINNPTHEEGGYSWTNYKPDTPDFKQFLTQNAHKDDSNHSGKIVKSTFKGKFTNGVDIYRVRDDGSKLKLAHCETQRDAERWLHFPKGSLDWADGQLPILFQKGSNLIVPFGLDAESGMHYAIHKNYYNSNR